MPNNAFLWRTLGYFFILRYDRRYLIVNFSTMKQATALAILKQGHHVFLTGQAGAGKTYLLNQYISYLHEHGVAVAMTASTGIAATHMNGMTIHAWSGIGIKDALDDSDFKRLKDREGFADRIKSVKVLIIDEVSMLHARQLDMVDEVLRHFREDERPFGGVQVIFSGDFFQLPPIGKKEESTKEKFAFMSKVWIALANTLIDGSPAIKVCYLSEQHRQKDETGELSLNTVLNQIRNQAVTPAAHAALLATKDNVLGEERTRLYTHNMNVDKINQDELDAINATAHDFEAITEGEPALMEALKKNVRAPEKLSLKKGAKVMFVKNNPNEEVYNGTIGEVVDFIKDSENSHLPKVKLADGRTLLVSYETWSIDDEDGVPLASYNQLPLCLAWAITVHKSQGMTLSAAEIDLSKTFELGQGYVALSRVQSLSGLKLLGLNQKSLLLDEFAVIANRRFLTLSAECETWFLNLDDTKKAADTATFLEKNKNPLLAKAPKTKQKPSQKPPTLDETLSLIKAGKSLDEISKTRALAVATIIEHLGKLLKNGELSTDDIAHLAPDDALIKDVKDARDTLSAQGEFTEGVRLRPLFDELRERVDYNTLRLCLLFIEPLEDNS